MFNSCFLVPLRQVLASDQTKYPARLYIEIPDPQCIVLDERPARLDHVTHEGGENFIGGDTVLDLARSSRRLLGSIVVSHN